MSFFKFCESIGLKFEKMRQRQCNLLSTSFAVLTFVSSSFEPSTSRSVGSMLSPPGGLPLSNGLTDGVARGVGSVLRRGWPWRPG